MGFDGLMLRRLVSHFAPNLAGARVNKIIKLNKTDFVFLLYKEKAFNLFISLDSNSPHFNVNNRKYQIGSEVNHFLSLLKTHLEATTLIGFKQVGLDRIIELKFKAIDETGAAVIKYLFLELTGKRLNLILAKDNLKIIEVYAKESIETSKRLLYPGSTYELPPPPKLADPLVEKYDSTQSPAQQFFGISPLIETEIKALGLKTSNFNDFINNLLNSNKIYLGLHKNKKDYHLLPLSIFEKNSIQEFDISLGIDTYYASLSSRKETSELASNLLRIVKNQIKRLNTRLERLEADLKSAQNFEQFKRFGDLIYSHGIDQAQGLKEIKLIDHETNQEVLVTLDPKISLFKNAERYFLKYHKAKNALVVLNEQITQLNQDLANLEYNLVAINDASTKELVQIEAELIAKKYLLPKAIRSKKKDEPIKIKEYQSPSGVKISLGKNNTQNDHLTFKVAKNYEFFFHVKDYPGAHVIAHTDKLSDDVILMAASLAAYYSKARDSKKVAVNYCQLKDVKKPRNYVPGLVIINNFKTIIVDPVKPE
jgi:predicted ribosome quality control (RQC) complex YloA/Tae2 family protein